jgi:hypothetical protein
VSTITVTSGPGDHSFNGAPPYPLVGVGLVASCLDVVPDPTMPWNGAGAAGAVMKRTGKSGPSVAREAEEGRVLDGAPPNRIPRSAAASTE